MRRTPTVLALILCVAAALFGTQSLPQLPAHAAVSLTPFWFQNCSGCGSVVPRDGKAVRVPFGVSTNARATNVVVRLDVSGINSEKLSLVGVDGPCTRSGSLAECAFGDVAAGSHRAWAVLASKPGVSHGPGGSVKVTASGSGQTASRTGEVRLSHSLSATDMVLKTTSTIGEVGGEARATVTVYNAGPSVQPYYEIFDVQAQPGLSFAGSDDCTVADGKPRCRAEDIAVGQTIKFVLRFKVTDCGRPHTFSSLGITHAIDDINPFNDVNSFTIKVAACSGGSKSAPAKAVLAPSPSSAASPVASEAPVVTPPRLSDEPSTDHAIDIMPASGSRSAITAPAWVVALAVVLSTALLAGWAVRRRRAATAVSSDAGQD